MTKTACMMCVARRARVGVKSQYQLELAVADSLAPTFVLLHSSGWLSFRPLRAPVGAFRLYVPNVRLIRSVPQPAMPRGCLAIPAVGLMGCIDSSHYWLTLYLLSSY